MLMRLDRLKRPLVLLLIGAGWLSILGNSAGPTITWEAGARSGPVQIGLPEPGQGSGCYFKATLSVPVRRATLLHDGQVLHEITCVDDRDCMTQLSIPPSLHGECRAMVPGDAAPAGDATATAPRDAGSGQEPAVHYRCGEGERTYEVRSTQSDGVYEAATCEDEEGQFRLIVETADGVRSTVDFKIEVEQPPGYFGC